MYAQESHCHQESCPAHHLLRNHHSSAPHQNQLRHHRRRMPPVSAQPGWLSAEGRRGNGPPPKENGFEPPADAAGAAGCCRKQKEPQQQLVEQRHKVEEPPPNGMCLRRWPRHKGRTRVRPAHRRHQQVQRTCRSSMSLRRTKRRGRGGRSRRVAPNAVGAAPPNQKVPTDDTGPHHRTLQHWSAAAKAELEQPALPSRTRLSVPLELQQWQYRTPNWASRCPERGRRCRAEVSQMATGAAAPPKAEGLQKGSSSRCAKGTAG